MKLSKRELILLCILLIAGSIYLFYNYLYCPMQVKTKALVVENARLKEEVKMERQKIQRAGDWKQERERLQEDYRQLMIKVPETAYIPEIVDFLENKAKDSQAALLSVNYNKKSNENQNDQNNNPKSTAPNMLEFEIKSGGSYYNLLSYLMKIENAPRLYVVSGVQIASPDNKKPGSTAYITEDGRVIPATQPEPLEGSTAYDGRVLAMKVRLAAFYDEKAIAGISGMEEKVTPGKGKENPYQR